MIAIPQPKRHEGAKHHHVALGEIDPFAGFVDHHEAKRDEAVDTTIRKAADGKLKKLHQPTPRAATAGNPVSMPSPPQFGNERY
ncbi:hypothetical protein GCM10017056_03900 [Seohaeicola zhoushanensis]|uniref:Uncharacterized protein n=1 Tax=Seohaeicola zhoushanensis TaxID=1569283 RepID=A0A8J3M7I5_9RHOB|nr:hypothetical protein GCM10017056_03900 [Seohaeicola zhoushanensis]